MTWPVVTLILGLTLIVASPFIALVVIAGRAFLADQLQTPGTPEDGKPRLRAVE